MIPDLTNLDASPIARTPLNLFDQDQIDKRWPENLFST
jgi:hypothetical protein